MERKEKTDFILNQMRLLIEVARIKDAEYEAERKDVKGKDPMGGGESEWVKVRVASRKVNEQFLTDKENEVRYPGLRVQGQRLTECAGAQAHLLRHDGSVRLEASRLPGHREVLPQGMGDAYDQRG